MDADRAAGDRRYHVDGEIVPAAEATVSVEDRGFQYGDGAFETLRAYGGSVFEWAAHRDRLEGTCDRLGMPDAVPDDLRERVDRTLDANGLADAYVKVCVTRGSQPGTLEPRPEVDPTVVVYAKPLPRGGVDGRPVWDAPARVRSVATRRAPDEVLPADGKTHNYLPSILARLELRGTDADEALVRDVDGALASGTSSNVFHVVDGVVHTPSVEAVPALPGVTRGVVLELARDAGVPVETGRYDPADVRTSDEAFLTNSTWELRPVASVDGREVGGGPVTDRLTRLFDERVEAHYR